jgi:small subunit ribosomal protein S6
MRTYETILIVHPEVVGDDQTAIIEKYKKILSDQGAEILKVDNWGTRALAYPVKKQSQGCYVLVVFEAEPTVISEFERRMRIDDMIIKFQTVLLENGYQQPATESDPKKVDEFSDEATDDETTPFEESEEESVEED